MRDNLSKQLTLYGGFARNPGVWDCEALNISQASCLAVTRDADDTFLIKDKLKSWTHLNAVTTKIMFYGNKRRM